MFLNLHSIYRCLQIKDTLEISEFTRQRNKEPQVKKNQNFVIIVAVPNFHQQLQHNPLENLIKGS